MFTHGFMIARQWVGGANLIANQHRDTAPLKTTIRLLYFLQNSPQNTGNAISETQNSKILRGDVPGPTSEIIWATGDGLASR